MRLWPSGETRQRILYALVTAEFLIGWLWLGLNLTRYWSELPHESHRSALVFAFVYPFPWLALLIKNRSKLQMALVVYAAFVVAMNIIFP